MSLPDSRQKSTATLHLAVPALEAMTPDDVAEWTENPERADLPFPVRTFRGRYINVDAAVAAAGAWASLTPGSTIRVLDIGGGVHNGGSPTAHDLHHFITELGMKPEVVVVDLHIPAALREVRPGITYVTSLAAVEGSFDVARILNVIEHVPLAVYDGLRAEAISRLKDGGFFVATQEAPPRGARTFADHRPALSWKDTGEHADNWYTPVTKVAQRRGTELTAIGLLPAVICGGGAHRFLMQGNFEDVVARIGSAGHRALDHECAGRLQLQGRLSDRSWDPLAALSSAARLAPTFAVQGRNHGIAPPPFHHRGLG